MKRLIETAAAAILAASCAGSAPAQNTASAHAETLLKATESWNGKAYEKYPSGKPQLTVLKITIAAHTQLPWHTHPVPNAGYVLSGQITIEDKASGKTRTFREGEALGESIDDAHRGKAGDEPATVIVFYAGTPDVPTSVPLKPGDKEY